MAPLTYQCRIQEQGAVKRMTKKLRTLVANSPLWCEKPSRGSQVERRLYENKELIFRNKILALDVVCTDDPQRPSSKK
jgi:hypothetical protein